MTITLGTRSLDRLSGVHPDLIAVVKRAASLATAARDFTVIEGVRSKEQMCANYGRGRSVAQCLAKGVPARFSEPSKARVTWLADPMMSNHRVHADGFGHAVDLAPFPIDWNDLERFRALGAIVKEAARIEHAAIAWGGDWARPDMPHFELAK